MKACLSVLLATLVTAALGFSMNVEDRRAVRLLRVDETDSLMGSPFPEVRICTHWNRMMIGLAKDVPAGDKSGVGVPLERESSQSAWIEGRIIRPPANMTLEKFGVGATVFGMWTFVGGFSNTTDIGAVIVLRDGQYFQTIISPSSGFGRSVGVSIVDDKPYAMISSDETLLILELTRGTKQFVEAQSLDLVELQRQAAELANTDSEVGQIIEEVQSIGDVAVQGDLAIVGCKNRAATASFILQRTSAPDASEAPVWRVVRMVALPRLVSFPKRIPLSPIEDKPSAPGEVFESSVTTSIGSLQRCAMGCKNCFYRHSVLVTGASADDDQLVTTSDVYNYGQSPRLFGTSLAMNDKLLAVLDRSPMIGRVYLYRKRENSADFRFVHRLSKPRTLFFDTQAHDVDVMKNGSVVSSATVSGDTALTLLIYDHATMTDQDLNSTSFVTVDDFPQRSLPLLATPIRITTTTKAFVTTGAVLCAAMSAVILCTLHRHI